MLSDLGTLSLMIFAGFWIFLTFLGLLVGFRPRSWRQKPAGKIPGEKKWHWPTVSRRH